MDASADDTKNTFSLLPMCVSAAEPKEYDEPDIAALVPVALKLSCAAAIAVRSASGVSVRTSIQRVQSTQLEHPR
jgi:hypothetical protein